MMDKHDTQTNGSQENDRSDSPTKEFPTEEYKKDEHPTDEHPTDDADLGQNAQTRIMNDIPLYTKTASDTQEHDAYGNTIIRKSGSSTPTIVLGSILIVCGVIATLAALFWTPLNLISVMDVDWRVMFAIALAAIGSILLLSSLFWTISTLLHRMKQ
ncbi:hypothetical protein [Bifidobacterium aquikefiricola]|uniref:Uncharacterized protein n=1 Tax=Bifidobacterium aquikefiricola TaxID=3059038 RepID=A0AB39U518_9BIFI